MPQSHKAQWPALYSSSLVISLVTVVYLLVLGLFLQNLHKSLISQVLMRIQGRATWMLQWNLRNTFWKHYRVSLLALKKWIICRNQALFTWAYHTASSPKQQACWTLFKSQASGLGVMRDINILMVIQLHSIVSIWYWLCGGHSSAKETLWEW